MPRTSITKCIEWDMGHRVPNHESKCRNPHGHRYKCEIEVAGDIIVELNSPEQGMITDFGFDSMHFAKLHPNASCPVFDAFHR